MIDSGATGNFIDTQVATDHGFKVLAKRRPYSLFTVDGDTIGSNKGRVTHETDSLLMTMLRGHTEEIQLDLVAMGTHSVILGMPWLKLHNPQIDWWKGRITMSQCQCGSDHMTPLGDRISPGREELRGSHGDIGITGILECKSDALFNRVTQNKPLPPQPPFLEPL
jgi:hypothetical protein